MCTLKDIQGYNLTVILKNLRAKLAQRLFLSSVDIIVWVLSLTSWSQVD